MIRHRVAYLGLILGAVVSLATPAPASSGAPASTVTASASELSGRPGLAGLGTPGVAPLASARTVALTIRTLPAMAGLRIRIDKATVLTNAEGVASVTGPHDFQSHTLALLDTSITAGDERHVFSRWAGVRDPEQVFNAALTGLTMRTNYTLTAAFSTQTRVEASYLDQQGAPIPPAQITGATIRSDTGGVIKMPTTGSIWLEATRITYQNSSLGVQDLSYTWETLAVDGTSIIDAGRQSFNPSRKRDVKVVGQFHNLTVSGYDALFSNGMGTEAVVTRPDGAVSTVPMNAQHQAVLEHLPRGTYQVLVKAGTAIVASHQVRLSRDSTITIPVISVVDTAVFVIGVLAIVIGVLLLGRRGLRRRLLSPFRRLRPVVAGSG